MTSLAKTGTALVTLALLTACSGGSSKAEEVTPTKDTATAAANAINLKAGDVPADWKSEAADNSDSTVDSTEKKIGACLGLQPSDLTGVVDLDSDSFSKGQPPSGIEVNSEVEVVGSLDQAERLRKAFSGDKAEGCLKKVYAEEAKAEAGDTPGVTFGEVAVSQKSGPSGTGGGFAFDITVPVTSQGVTIQVKASIIAFFVKHTEVSLQTTSFGDVPSGISSEDLVKKLVDRAKASAV